ncbi:MAG: hypothetical protein FWG15_01785 [Propionibacteriaceae bacterium]|jgi:hypothetical protein|nr:hypothetical protein [Propionibacteriaceae bacterium]
MNDHVSDLPHDLAGGQEPISEDTISDGIDENLGNLPNQLRGLPKMIVTRALNSGMADQVKKALSLGGINNASDALHKVIQAGIDKGTRGVRIKISTVLTMIVAALGVIAVLITMLAKGNLWIPVIVVVLLVMLIWWGTGSIFQATGRKVSSIVVKTIETRMAKTTDTGGEPENPEPTT